jgi:hypothetical protein
MTDEAKPPTEGPEGAAKRPRKPASDGAKAPRKPAAKKPAPKRPAAKKAAAQEPAAQEPAATKTEPDAAAAADPFADIVAPDAVTEVVATDAATTQVMADAQPTQVMPAVAQPAAPPPFAPVPRVITPSGGDDKRTTIWLVIALAALAVLAVVLVWAFVLRDSGEEFVGNWAPIEGGGGGLVVTLRDGDFEVAMFDEDLELMGTYPAARDGDTLTFRFTDTQSGRGLMKATLTHDEERDVLTLRLTTADAQGAAQEYVRVDALEAAVAPAPTPTPTASATLSPSPSPSPTGSASPTPSLTPSPTGTDMTQYDQQVQNGIVAIAKGLNAWYAANGNLFPPVEEVTQDGELGQYVSPWPTNPYTGEPMAVGSEPGFYMYEQLNGGQSYKLVGQLSYGPFTQP